ncbi:hypothetical protein V2G26_000193 [Clonostachys chloroleuca]
MYVEEHCRQTICQENRDCTDKAVGLPPGERRTSLTASFPFDPSTYEKNYRTNIPTMANQSKPSTAEALKKKSPAQFTLGEYVEQRCYTAGKGSEAKRTGGLATCVRVAVVGSYPDGNTSKWGSVPCSRRRSRTKSSGSFHPNDRQGQEAWIGEPTSSSHCS